MKFVSPVFSAVSGSIAGITYAHNRGGLYTRARATPTNPNSAAQQAQRAALGAANEGWANLSAANQQLWEDYAAATSWTGPLGNSITLSGQQAYLRWASVRARLGDTLNSAPGAGVSGFGAPPDSIVAEATGPSVTVGISGGASNSGPVYIRRSGVLPSGQFSVKRPLILDGSADISQFATSQAITPTQSPTTGQRIVYTARIAYDDGRLSQEFTDVVTVAAS